MKNELSYLLFILHCKQRKILENTYTLLHHIIPKCMGGTNSKLNLIILTAELHYIAHQLLAKENPDNDSLQFAWFFMSHNTNGRNAMIDSKDYQKAKEKMKLLQKKRMIGNTYGKGKNKENCGMYHAYKIILVLTGKTWNSASKCAKENNVSKSLILRCLKNELYTCHNKHYRIINHYE